MDAHTKVAIGARVKVTPSGQRLLVDDEGKVSTGVAQHQDVLVLNQATFETQFDPSLQEHSLTQELEASLRVMHPTLAEGVDDMINLGEMTEAGLLRNLMLRHKRSVIYVSRTNKNKLSVVFLTKVEMRFTEPLRLIPHKSHKSPFLYCRLT